MALSRIVTVAKNSRNAARMRYLHLGLTTACFMVSLSLNPQWLDAAFQRRERLDAANYCGPYIATTEVNPADNQRHRDKPPTRRLGTDFGSHGWSAIPFGARRAQIRGRIVIPLSSGFTTT